MKIQNYIIRNLCHTKLIPINSNISSNFSLLKSIISITNTPIWFLLRFIQYVFCRLIIFFFLKLFCSFRLFKICYVWNFDGWVDFQSGFLRGNQGWSSKYLSWYISSFEVKKPIFPHFKHDLWWYVVHLASKWVISTLYMA